MIDLLRLKAIGTGLAFGYAIAKDCDKRFQAHCRRHPGQVTFYTSLPIQLETHFITENLRMICIYFGLIYQNFRSARNFSSTRKL